MDQPHISGSAVIITGGLLDTNNAKTAHGLLRVSNRFKIIGVIDEKFSGQDSGDIVLGKSNDIPISNDINSFIADFGKPKYAIIGMATKGGVLPKELYASVKNILAAGVELINGLHEPISQNDELRKVADESNSVIHDIRISKKFEDLHFWEGKVQEITATKIAVLGTDCALGKRTTSRLIETGLNDLGHKAEMIYTGQTGWMQGAGYGLLFDATPNDFISGEIEHALYECWKNEKPEVLIMEGQSGLRNPSGPCGSEFIISGACDGVVLQYSPIRKKFKGLDNYPANAPDIMDEVKLIETLGSRVIAITVNEENLSDKDKTSVRSELASRTDLPVIFPFTDDLAPLLNSVLAIKK